MSAPKINVKQKSAAEFFSEHQQIAGFDNPGKSLYTSIRELVENSLDAAESIGVLPSIDVSITEYTEAEHNSLHGITNTQVDSTTPNAFPEESQPDDLNLVLTPPTASQELAKPSKVSKKTTSISSQRMYYKLTCKDNGCGMSSHNIGELLGRVLSGSKHGTKQTRGKFGLGAKMVCFLYVDACLGFCMSNIFRYLNHHSIS